MTQPPTPFQQQVQQLDYAAADSQAADSQAADSQDAVWIIRFFAWGAIVLASMGLLESCIHLVSMSIWETRYTSRNVTGIILLCGNGLAALGLLLSAFGLRRLQRRARPIALMAAIIIVLITFVHWMLYVVGFIPSGSPYQAIEENLLVLFAYSVNAMRIALFPIILIWYLNSRPVRAFFATERR